MDPSHNFPPSPRDMYMYRPAEHMNGHKVQSPSPSRGRPPPILPERKPETQLSTRTSRSSFTSRGSASSDVGSPPLSPSYIGQGYHTPQHHHHHTHYPDNKPFAYVGGFNQEQTVKIQNLTDTNRVKMEREASPLSRRGSGRGERSIGSSDIQRYNRSDDYTSDFQNDAAVYQRIDRNRVGSSPDRFLSGDQGYNQSGSFHGSNTARQPEGIYGQFVEPSSGTTHRPSLTYVPPPVVPTMQTDHGKADKAATRDQHDLQRHIHQHKVVNHTESASPAIPQDTASHHHHHYHHHHCNHHHHPHHQHDHPQAASSHQHSHTPSASLTSPIASPKHAKSSKRVKPKPEILPPPPSIPTPPPPVPLQERCVSSGSSTRTSSPPLPPPPLEIGASSKSRSSIKAIEPKASSPLAANNTHCTTITSQPHQHNLNGSNQHNHNHHHHPPHQLVDLQPNDQTNYTHHQMKAPTVPTPPPPPPLRTSSSPQFSINHLDLNPAPSGIKSSPSAVRPPGVVLHPIHKQHSLATMDDLVQVKLRAVNDPSPHSPLVSPVMAGDKSPGAINVRLRPTPGKFRNIYAEDETTLPPPPPLDDLDELPPPPPPPELLCDDLTSLSSDPYSLRSVVPPSHSQTGERDASLVEHSPLRQPHVINSPPKPLQQSSGIGASTRPGASGSIGVLENSLSALEQLILEAVSNMDFEIPDDIDLTQCPGLVEINKSTPNWKRDMIEKKNQERIEEYVKKILKEREQEAKWKNVPEWKRKILQKKEEEEGIVATPAPEAKPAPGKKPAKKAPVPPPKEKEVKEDVSATKSRSDIVPAALSIDPEELAAMPPWKRELLFKRDKVPVTFSNEFNPEDEAENENGPAS